MFTAKDWNFNSLLRLFAVRFFAIATLQVQMCKLILVWPPWEHCKAGSQYLPCFR